MLKSAEDKEIALAAAENDYLFQQQRLAQAQKAGADQALVAAQNTLNANQYLNNSAQGKGPEINQGNRVTF